MLNISWKNSHQLSSLIYPVSNSKEHDSKSTFNEEELKIYGTCIILEDNETLDALMSLSAVNGAKSY